MTGMNRLSPLIVRRAVHPRPPVYGSRSGRAVAMTRRQPFAGVDAAAWLEDLKLFATGWVGGLIFFGTLLG
jgi:hypothetical protein